MPEDLTGPGKQLVAQLQKEVKGGVELYAPYAGQAASVLLDAIATSGERAGELERDGRRLGGGPGVGHRQRDEHR